MTAFDLWEGLTFLSSNPKHQQPASPLPGDLSQPANNSTARSPHTHSIKHTHTHLHTQTWPSSTGVGTHTTKCRHFIPFKLSKSQSEPSHRTNHKSPDTGNYSENIYLVYNTVHCTDYFLMWWESKQGSMLSLCRSAPPEKCNWPVIITVFKSVKYSTAYIHKAEHLSLALIQRWEEPCCRGRAMTLGWRLHFTL